MAEAVILYAVQRLADLINQEAVFLHGVRDEIQWLQRELTRMQCFLKDADQRLDTDDGVRLWVSEVRDAAYDIEDIVDTFMLKSAEEGRGFLASVKRYSCIFNRGVNLYGIGKDIEQLKQRIIDISRSTETYGIRTVGSVERSSNLTERFRHIRRTSSIAGNEQVVGFEENTTMLVEQLLKDEQQLSVISILGMGGLGKTTLARKLFNSIDVKGRFDWRAWVCVSQEYTTHDLLQKTIKSFRKPTKEDLELMEKLTEDDLEQHLYEFLEGRRYLLVIDDIWDKQAWESLRRALPDNRNGSRIIITTRKKDVATITDEKNFVHKLRFLNQEESWRLFCTKAFPDTADGQAGNCPPGLEKSGREMVEKCGGLPLAIIVLGGLLSKRQLHEWHTVKNHLWWHLTKDSDHVSSILALSYDELPYQLKSCFLYLSLFPEDSLIDTEKLIQLWIAEGFIPQGEEEMEDVAEEYLKELIDRSMIQIAERYLDRVKTCRIHDLLRELAIKKAKALDFLDIYHEKINLCQSSTSLIRRQVVASGNKRYVSSEHINPQLRSLLFFNPDLESLNVKHLKILCSRLRFLRVLKLEDTRIERSGPSGKVVRLPNLIGKLIHLRYFGCKSSSLVEFPPSIGNIRNLKTLVATGNSRLKLPAQICKLHQLRHLIACPHGPLQISTLTSLQTLKCVNFQQWVEIDSTNLTNLRELEIREIPYTNMDFILHLRNLRSLTLQTNIGFNALLPLSQFLHLIKLKLDGKIENLPGIIDGFPPNLYILILYGSFLKEESIPALEQLSSLTILELGSDSFCGNKMVFSGKCFSHLQVLRLSWLRLLETLEVESGAMPRLKYFSIQDCHNVLMIPERLRMLPLPQEW
ncbi:Disease resistance protein [Melia azedarach]|uniref:Disease resistance protein n=1 Tax=Melia azedarach TaxID=155640 RepID=A0ACC1Y0I7_MELAZ|nr:Disease resistance protein [Melia azedarach]